MKIQDSTSRLQVRFGAWRLPYVAHWHQCKVYTDFWADSALRKDFGHARALCFWLPGSRREAEDEMNAWAQPQP